jgi:hypothetical protein
MGVSGSSRRRTCCRVPPGPAGTRGTRVARAPAGGGAVRPGPCVRQPAGRDPAGARRAPAADWCPSSWTGRTGGAAAAPSRSGRAGRSARSSVRSRRGSRRPFGSPPLRIPPSRIPSVNGASGSGPRQTGDVAPQRVRTSGDGFGADRKQARAQLWDFRTDELVLHLGVAFPADAEFLFVRSAGSARLCRRARLALVGRFASPVPADLAGAVVRTGFVDDATLKLCARRSRCGRARHARHHREPRPLAGQAERLPVRWRAHRDDGGRCGSGVPPLRGVRPPSLTTDACSIRPAHRRGARRRLRS